MKSYLFLLFSLFVFGCSSGSGGTNDVVTSIADTWTSFSITKPGFQSPETIRLVETKLVMWKFGFGGEYYDFSSSSWTTMATANSPNITTRNATASNGRYFLLCGRVGAVYSGGIYDSQNNTWQTFANCSIFGSANDLDLSSTIGDKLYFAEQEINLATSVYTSSVFTPPSTIFGTAGISNGTRISLSNGTDGYYFDSTLVPVSYPPQTILNSRAGMLSAVVGSKFYLFGGQRLIGSTYYWQTDGATYSPETNTWTNMASNAGPVASMIAGPIKAFTIGQKIYFISPNTSTTFIASYFDTLTKLWNNCNEVGKPIVGALLSVFSTGTNIIVITDLNGSIYSGAIYSP